VSWKTVPLVEVTELITRGISPIYCEGDGITILNQKCIRNHEISLGPARKHDSIAKVVKEDRKLKYGDVLINSTGTGTLGRVAQILSESDEELTVDSHVTIVRPQKELFYLPFFGYMLIAIEDQLKRAGEGASGQTELRRTAVANEFLVAYPTSKAIQQKIVTKLDAIFAEIDKATAVAEANAKNADALLSAFISQSFSNLKKHHNYIQLGDVCTGVEYGSSSKSEPTGRVPVLRMGNILGGKLDLADLVFTSNEDDVAKYSLNNGDVLFNRTNSPLHVGKSAVFYGDQPTIFAGYLIRINFDKTKVLPEFLCFYLNSKEVREYGYTVMSHSINQANINGSKLKCYPFLLPSIDVQKQIVDEITLMQDKTDLLKSNYKLKSNLLSIEKNSILRQAFNGELVRD